MEYISNADIHQLCALLRDAIKASGVSQAEVARRGGLTEKTIYSIMRGEANPRGSTIFRIAKALGTTSQKLISGNFESQADLCVATDEIKKTHGPEAVSPGGSVMKTPGAPTPLPGHLVGELIKEICRTLSVSEWTAIAGIQYMKAKDKEEKEAK